MNHSAPSPRGTLTRRTLTKGAAWSAPVILATAQAPAYAASTCLDRAIIDKAFADAQAYAQANYYCNGEPAKIQFNFYQPALALDGTATDVYVDVKNLSTCTINFSPKYPLRLDIFIRNNNVLNSYGRSITSVATSWGGATRPADTSIANAPVGSVDETIWWDFSGTLPGMGLGDNEADLRIGFGDGATGSGRWNDYITLTPLANSGAPTFESIGASSTAACRDYYNYKLSQWVTPFQFYVYGPLNGYNTGGVDGGVAITPGTVIDSRKTGNSSPGGAASQNGIW